MSLDESRCFLADAVGGAALAHASNATGSVMTFELLNRTRTRLGRAGGTTTLVDVW